MYCFGLYVEVVCDGIDEQCVYVFQICYCFCVCFFVEGEVGVEVDFVGICEKWGDFQVDLCVVVILVMVEVDYVY